ncbi:Fc.00g034220.m01.CDS01 [Cosmosporella sp. VM-42]
MDPQRPPAPGVLASQSTLDHTQSAGLLNTLSREISLIQGPPGTGKSYTGEKIVKVLLQSRERASLGPILCVCYTNHALDQLLEHLLDDGTKGIIRIGSRSKSERLQGLNLRTVVKRMLQTKSEKSGLWAAEQNIREHVREGKDLLRELSSCESWVTIKTLLASEDPRQYAELFGGGQDGWQRVTHQPEMVIDKWRQGGHDIVRPPLPLENLKFAPLQNMTNAERRLLHHHWLKTIRDPIITELSKLNENYTKAIKHRDQIRGDVDLRCLHMADVVGVTTTGLARNLDLLRKLRCKVMLCEEAGEVLEAHNLTALLPSVEHAILIGDHLQLRPQIQNYDLQSANSRGRQYSLDMSLFERLVHPPHETDPRVPYSILETQRRMHPSIAELVRSTLYPSLKDSETVKDYPEVVGMRRRLFWFHHNHLEDAGENNNSLSTSRSNSFEVEMTAALVSHLSQQGNYAPGDIAVITPYLGQLQLLRRRMESMFEICVNERDLDELQGLQADGSDTLPSAPLVSKTTLLKSVRVATVDNFQGEEAKVIVICLVRSNRQANCGFLQTFNRINVLLSRAQHGMYIIGNADTYKSVPMWADVTSMLAARGNLGMKLELQCARHPKTPILVSQPDHFVQFSPESGCNLPVCFRCNTREEGKVTKQNHGISPCAAPCDWVPCSLRCEKMLDCGHQCPSICGETCPESKYCQQCACDDIKLICVDFLEMKEYHEVDLNEEPCIFPDCGHFLAVSSMDGQMEMAFHYELDENGLPRGIKRSSKPLSMDDEGIKVCATCRGPLRNISRYGRIVRRAMLDEATKKFISWSNTEYLALASGLIAEQEKLSSMGPTAIRARNAEATGNLTLPRSRQRQLEALKEHVATKRYDDIIKFRRHVQSYAKKVRKDEQPFQLVGELVRHANVERGTENEFNYDQSIIQVKGSLLASALVLKCDILILSDFSGLLDYQGSKLAKPDVKLNLSGFLLDCESLIQLAHSTVHPREETQGHIFYAQLCALSRSLASSTPLQASAIQAPEPSPSTTVEKPETLDELKELGLGHIKQARKLLEDNDSINALKRDIDAVEETLNGGVYHPVTAEELREVYMASIGELSGTGHWYRCQNGHPFTINRCGMAMEEATCPECGALIGGRDHVSVEGVRHATEIEEIAREMGGVRLK